MAFWSARQYFFNLYDLFDILKLYIDNWWISRVWLWFDPNSILWVLSIQFRRSLLIKCIIIFLRIHLRKIGEWMHMRIESLATLQSLWAIHFFYQKTFVDFVFNSQILHLFFFLWCCKQIQFEWLWAKPRRPTVFQAQVQGIPNVS